MNGTAERRRQVFVGLPEKGEIGREDILEALRLAGIRAARRRRQAADALRSTSVCKDRWVE